MKFPTVFALITTASTITSVAAVGPWLLFNDKFSKSSMEKWAAYISTDSKITAAYKEGIQHSDVRAHGKCPPNLKDAAIELTFASGAYRTHKSNGNWAWNEWKNYFITSPGDINVITLIYNINSGFCGTVIVKTDLGLGTTSQEYKWQEPEYIPYSQGSRLSESIKWDSITCDVNEALSKAKKELPAIKNGFGSVQLGPLYDGRFPRVFSEKTVWHFQKVKDAYQDVVVTAAGGKVGIN